MPLPIQLNADINAQLKDAGLIAADAAWQVGAANKIFDTSPGGVATFTTFAVSVKVTAIEIASNDELYRLLIQGSTSATFADTFTNLAELTLGANEVLAGDVDSVIGEYLILGHNDVGGTVYRYLRGFTDVNGTIATGINFQAWMSGIPR
jgi:hypothetical protein